jgi:UDP-N-acetylglucosamine 2-epimerase (non-hydrolysing)
MTISLLTVVGARPNFMKIAPLQRALDTRPDEFAYRLVHTGQHFDANMSDVFFRDLAIRPPDYYLGAGGGGHGEQTGRIMIEFEKVLLEHRPDLVVVAGDVNSTIACALDAAKLQIPVAHVEAGCRSLDRRMPEEINRILTDAIADLLFTIDEQSGENLRREGIAPDKIHFVGDTMIDSLVFALEKTAPDDELLRRLEIQPGGFSVVTIHRPANVDCEENLSRVVELLDDLQTYLPVIFPVHPRTKKSIDRHPDLARRLAAMPRLRLIEPLGYFAFVRLFSQSRMVVTDSGSIQQETSYLNIPCLTLRENTERPVTLTLGSNVLLGLERERFRAEVERIMAGHIRPAHRIPLWDGRAAPRIVEVIARYFAGGGRTRA